MILKCNSWCILTILTVIWMYCTRIGDCCFFQCFIACFSDEGNGFCRAFLLHFKLLHIYNKKSKSSEFKPGTYRGPCSTFYIKKGTFVLCNVQANWLIHFCLASPLWKTLLRAWKSIFLYGRIKGLKKIKIDLQGKIHVKWNHSVTFWKMVW